MCPQYLKTASPQHKEMVKLRMLPYENLRLNHILNTTSLRNTSYRLPNLHKWSGMPLGMNIDIHNS